MFLRSYLVAQNWLHDYLEKREEGATAVEYALMVGILGLGILGSFAFYVKSVGTAFNKVRVLT
jgi:Flp pilus assembly pilin Flp